MIVAKNLEMHICSKRAACDGGMFSRVFLPLVKRRCLASLTLAKPRPLLYIIATNRSCFCMWRDPWLKHDGALVSASSLSVSTGVFCQDAQAVFLPQPRKCDVGTL